MPGENTEHGIQCRLMGKFIVRDWKGVPDENGNNVKYSEGKAAALLESNVDFFLWTIKKAGEIAAEALAERGELLGKSSNASNGKKKPVARKSATKTPKTSTTSNPPQTEAQ